MRWPLILLLVLCSSAAHAGDLYQLINARLSLMKAVAVYKWHNNLPLEDSSREAIVLDSAAQAGLAQGITKTSSRAVFRAQIQAAKEIQRHWFNLWQNQVPPPIGRDLATEIRPHLLALGTQITAALGEHRGPSRTDFENAISVTGISKATRDHLFEALQAVEFYPNRLAQILDTGILRVGTTGDYPPFSSESEGDRQGIDIDLANDLGHTLGVAVVFVDTSWPTLMSDLESGKFDIAMSGITRNLQRQRTAFFSVPYHHGGKTPIVRCTDQPRLNTLSAIDQPGVKVVVNPGGTNQRFVDANIKTATVTVHPDNRSIFGQIVSGAADVMITDSIEVRLQASRHPTLCPAMPDVLLTRLDKAVLMPQDTALKGYVDLWLERRHTDGKIKDMFTRYLD